MKKIIIFLLVLLLLMGGALTFIYMSKSTPDKPYNYDPGDAFVTDLSSGSQLIKADLTISFKNDKYKKYLEENNFKIRNIIIFVLREKTPAQVKSNDIESVINKEIIQKLQSELKLDNIDRVYFNEFIVE
ncbi:MAG: flagellar basal body-associated FliL family protein [Bacillota bacterium]|nr:flagellar basal body-associated FliL family protein [Bacillota bacterium]